MVSKFPPHTDYLRLNRNIRGMMEETIEVFKEVATFFMNLLNNGKKIMKGGPSDFVNT